MHGPLVNCVNHYDKSQKTYKHSGINSQLQRQIRKTEDRVNRKFKQLSQTVFTFPSHPRPGFVFYIASVKPNILYVSPQKTYLFPVIFPEYLRRRLSHCKKIRSIGLQLHIGYLINQFIECGGG